MNFSTGSTDASKVKNLVAQRETIAIVKQVGSHCLAQKKKNANLTFSKQKHYQHYANLVPDVCNACGLQRYWKLLTKNDTRSACGTKREF